MSKITPGQRAFLGGQVVSMIGISVLSIILVTRDWTDHVEEGYRAEIHDISPELGLMEHALDLKLREAVAFRNERLREKHELVPTAPDPKMSRQAIPVGDLGADMALYREVLERLRQLDARDRNSELRKKRELALPIPDPHGRPEAR